MTMSISLTDEIWPQVEADLRDRPRELLIAGLLAAENPKLEFTDRNEPVTADPLVLGRHLMLMLAETEELVDQTIARIRKTDTWDDRLDELWIDDRGYFVVHLEDVV